MSPRSTRSDQQAISPAPSVLDAVNASRGPSVIVIGAQPSTAPVEESEEDSNEVEVAETIATPPTPPTPPTPAKAAKAPKATKAAPRADAAPSSELTADAASFDELGHYVTRVMTDARRAAAEFLASVDVDAARRAAVITAQADAEATSLREAAIADADKIRADARLEGDRLVSERLRLVIDLTDELYAQAELILADAERPDVARRHLARFVTALTQSADDASAATRAGKSRS